jgi:predicted O-methyltransferase YrrM
MTDFDTILAAELRKRAQSRRDWGRAHAVIGQRLAERCQFLPDGPTVEIGVAYGDMSAIIMQGLPGRLHIGIDPYQHSASYVDAMNDPQPVQDVRRLLAEQRLRETGRRFAMVSTREEAEDRLREPIAFAFVDGDHSRAGVAADLEWIWPRMAKGSVLMGHDYMDPGWPGVTEAVHAFFQPLGVPVVQLPACIWGVSKP